MTELSALVNEQHARLGDAPAAVAPQAFGPVDEQRILQLIGLDPRDARAHAVIAVAKRYGLDPVLGHIEILPRVAKPYVTRDGHLFIAHRSGQLDGIEVIDGPRKDGSEWVCRVAVYRRDMSHPFVYPGRCALGAENGPEMAIARAERRALKRAFAITLPPLFGDDEGLGVATVQSPPAWQPEAPPEAPSAPQSAEQPAPPVEAQAAPVAPMNDSQRRAIFALLKKLGVDTEDRTARLNVIATAVGHPVGSLTELGELEAGVTITALGRLLDEQMQNSGRGE